MNLIDVPFKGVCYLISGKRTKRWAAHIQVERKNQRLGYFLTEAAAQDAYLAAAERLFGEFAYHSRIDESAG